MDMCLSLKKNWIPIQEEKKSQEALDLKLISDP